MPAYKDKAKRARMPARTPPPLAVLKIPNKITPNFYL